MADSLGVIDSSGEVRSRLYHRPLLVTVKGLKGIFCRTEKPQSRAAATEEGTKIPCNL